MLFSRIILILATLFLSIPSFACTTFFIHHNGQMIFGRNYDWMADAGMICTNQRGLAKTSVKNANGPFISWVSKYGSVTFNQYGKEFPTGDMNEQGLVVELMWLNGTSYPAADDRAAVGVLQWIQYQLDNHGTVAEVIASDKKIRIGSGDVPLHYLVADAGGNAATIEFLNGKMTVHQDKELPFPVLTNDTYDLSIRSYKAGTGYGNNSLERFNIACEMIKKIKSGNSQGPLTDQAFSILENVSQGNYTKWSIVYDITNKKIHFRTDRFRQERSVNFHSFNFSCQTPPLAMDMNTPQKGDISTKLTAFSPALNQATLDQAARQSGLQVTISEAEKKEVLEYAGTTKCQ